MLTENETLEKKKCKHCEMDIITKVNGKPAKEYFTWFRDHEHKCDDCKKLTCYGKSIKRVKNFPETNYVCKPCYEKAVYHLQLVSMLNT